MKIILKFILGLITLAVCFCVLIGIIWIFGRLALIMDFIPTLSNGDDFLGTLQNGVIIWVFLGIIILIFLIAYALSDLFNF